MPSFLWSNLMVASQTGFAPLAGWQFERVPSAYGGGAYVSILQRSTLVGMMQAIFSGSQNMLQRCPIQAGGTIGVTPTSLNTPVVDFQSAPDDLLSILDDETAATAPTVDGIITLEPM